MFDKERIELWLYWIREREAIRKARTAGKPPPWSQDPVFNEVRFTNVRRMDDRVSQWLLYWYAHPLSLEDAVVAATFGRLVNRPETLRLYGDHWAYWNEDLARSAMRLRAKTGPVFTGAYIINSATKGSSKAETVIDIVNTVRQWRKEIASAGSHMERTHEHLCTVHGIGSFIAGQIVADMRYITTGDGLWVDRDTWAPRGPGSARGMAWLMGRDAPVNDQSLFTDGLVELSRIARKRIPSIHKDRGLEAMDYQNTLCELSKYVRVTAGGRAKNRFDVYAAAQRPL